MSESPAWFVCQVCGKPAGWTCKGPAYCSTPKPLITGDEHAPPQAGPSYYRPDKPSHDDA